MPATAFISFERLCLCEASEREKYYKQISHL